MPDFTLYGIALTAIILGIVKLLQDEAGLSDYHAGWLRAVLAGIAFFVVQNSGWIEVQVPNFEFWFVQVCGVVGTILTVKGYWPEVQRVGYRAQGR